MDAVAERRLELRLRNDTLEVVVALARPEQVTLDEWKCRYEVRFGDAATIREVHGGDSLQALQLAIASLDFELELGAKDRDGELHHLDERFNSILENSGMQRKT